MMSMLVGLLILSFQIQHIVEEGLIVLLLQWWESKQIPYLVKKNMIAHKHRNQKVCVSLLLSPMMRLNIC